MQIEHCPQKGADASPIIQSYMLGALSWKHNRLSHPLGHQFPLVAESELAVLRKENDLDLPLQLASYLAEVHVICQRRVPGVDPQNGYPCRFVRGWYE